MSLYSRTRAPIIEVVHHPAYIVWRALHENWEIKLPVDQILKNVQILIGESKARPDAITQKLMDPKANMQFLEGLLEMLVARGLILKHYPEYECDCMDKTCQMCGRPDDFVERSINVLELAHGAKMGSRCQWDNLRSLLNNVEAEYKKMTDRP